VAKKLQVTRDVIFVESRSWDWARMLNTASSSPPTFNVVYINDDGSEEVPRWTLASPRARRACAGSQRHHLQCMLDAEEPRGIDATIADTAWSKAMDEEMAAITDNDTWELATLPAGHKAIGLKWVYKNGRGWTSRKCLRRWPEWRQYVSSSHWRRTLAGKYTTWM
jgi:hypothetical protein